MADVDQIGATDATDGDSRRRKLELESIGRGTFGISADDFIFRAEVVDGEVKIMAQDLRHCGKKIRASALSDARYMMFGRHAASLEHVLPIQRQHVRFNIRRALRHCATRLSGSNCDASSSRTPRKERCRVP